MQIKRRNFLYGLAGLSVPFIISSCTDTAQESETETGEKASKKMPQKIRIGYQTSPNDELLAKAMGIAQEAFTNVEVEYINFKSGRDVNTAMITNGIDVGLIGSVGAAVGIAQELPYQVYFIHSIIGDAEALAVRRNINSIADLRGKKIGVPFGSTTHFAFLSLLEREKINENEIDIIDMQPQNMVAAWQRGDIDGGYVWYPHLQKIIDEEGKVLITSGDLAAKYDIITADVGIVSKKFAQQYPEAVKKYVGVLNEAIAFYNQKPQEAAQTISKEMGISPEASLQAMSKIIWLTSEQQAEPKYLGTPDNVGKFAEVLQESAKFMVSQKEITSAPDLKTYQANIANQFL